MRVWTYSFLPVAAVLASVALLPASAQDGTQADNAPAAPLERATDVWSDYALTEEEAARQGRAALPFTPEQIEALGRILRETQAATARGHGEPPQGRVRRIRLDDGAIAGTRVSGTSVPRIALRRGYVTAVSFTDSTGAPWPIEEALVDRRFLPPGNGGEGESGSGLMASHLLYLAPQAAYLRGNAVVKLRDLAEPVVASLRGTGADADFRVEIRLGVPGPERRSGSAGAACRLPRRRSGAARAAGRRGAAGRGTARRRRRRGAVTGPGAGAARCCC